MATEFKKTGIIQTSVIEQPYASEVAKNSISINPNLLQNTYFTSDYSSYITVDNNFRFNGMPTMKISVSGYTDYSGIGGSQTVPNVKAGDVVTASAGVYKAENHGIDWGYEMRIYQIHNDGSDINGSGFEPGDAWTAGKGFKVGRTYTLDSNLAQAVFNFDLVRNGTYWFAAPKVEVGNKATPWWPSTADTLYTKYQYSSANTTIINPSRFDNIIEN